MARTVREAAELASSPSPDFTAAPLDSNLHEWHFTLRGPPSPSPYAAGLYHGRIVLPSSYPLRPPSFRFLTPSGRFEPNREICLSISGHHEETWQPAWGLRTALTAIRSFMAGDAMGQVGGVEAGRDVRERLATESRAWRCFACGGSRMEDVEREMVRAAEAAGAEAAPEQSVPEELKLAYRDELDGGAAAEPAADELSAVPAERDAASLSMPTAAAQSGPPQQPPAPRPTPTVPVTLPVSVPPAAPAPAAAPRRPPPAVQYESNWMDLAIAGIALALFVMVVRKLVQML